MAWLQGEGLSGGGFRACGAVSRTVQGGLSVITFTRGGFDFSDAPGQYEKIDMRKHCQGQITPWTAL